MKKYLPMMVLCGLISFSCNKAIEPEHPQAQENGYYTFVLNADMDQDLTRTEYAADEVTFSWSTDDEISVLFHKGETHKFFTLKTSQGGSKTAKFSGQIESGYELGASETEGGVAWALFPASSQHSWNTETHLPDFYQAPEVDYTQSHFSANIPMYANGDAEGSFTFKYLTSCYKFVFTDVAASKVKLMVHSAGSGGWYLSGKSPVKADGSSYYLQCYNGEGSRDVSYIEAVGSDKKAVFYVPFRGWEPFTPEITLVNMDSDSELLHVTAKTALAAAAFGRIVILPEKSLADAYIPAIGINGDMSDWADKPVGEGSNDYILEWKYASDENNVYFMYKVNKALIKTGNWGSYIYTGFDNDNDGTTGTDAGAGVTGGFEAMAAVYPWRDNGEGGVECLKGQDNQGTIACPVGTDLGHVTVAGTFDGDYCYIETSIPRNLIGDPTGEITVNHGMNWNVTGAAVITLAGPAEAKPAVINAEDVAVKVGKSVNIGATTNSSAPIKYVSAKTSIATVSSDGTVTGVKVGSTTITLSVDEVEGKFTAATKTINVTVSEASSAVIDVDGDISDWEGISPAYLNDSKSRIREFRFKNDADNVYFLIKMRKNRSWLDPDAYLGIGFDTDNDNTSGGSIGNVPGCEVRVKSNPFTNTSQGSQPVCVNGFDSSAEIDGKGDASAVYVFMYDDGSSLDSSSSNIYLELSIPRNKLNLPATGTITVGCSYNWYITDSVSVTLE